MKYYLTKKPLVILACILACALCPTEARADAINFGFVAVAGVVILVPLTLFTMFVEGIPLSVGLRIPYQRTLKILLVANIASMLAGLPVKILNAELHSLYMPHPLAAYFRAYPYMAVFGALNFFLVTLLVEFGVVALWCRKAKIPVGWGKLAFLVLVMNVMTYAVLAPLNYWATRPRHDVKTFTDDSSWAQHPLTEIYYISTNGNLCAIMTDGSKHRVVIPDSVRDYQYLPQQGLFLYRNCKDTLCLFHESDGQTIECWQTSQRYSMNEVTISPDGKTVAYLEERKDKYDYMSNREPMLFDTETRQRYPTAIIFEDTWRNVLSWSDSSDTFYIGKRKWQSETQQYLTTVTSLTVSNNVIVAQQIESQPRALIEAYGRFGVWFAFHHDSDNYIDIRAFYGLGSCIVIKQDNDKWYIADNPGLLKLGTRCFSDVCLLENGKEFVFSDSKNGIYLVNIAERKVGLITSGECFITLTPRYKQNLRNWETEEY